jgi:hypothetical protein
MRCSQFSPVPLPYFYRHFTFLKLCLGIPSKGRQFYEVTVEYSVVYYGVHKVLLLGLGRHTSIQNRTRLDLKEPRLAFRVTNEGSSKTTSLVYEAHFNSNRILLMKEAACCDMFL